MISFTEPASRGEWAPSLCQCARPPELLLEQVEAPALAHPRLLVEPRRSRRVLRIDVQQDRSDPERAESLEAAEQKSLRDAPASPGGPDGHDVDPAGILHRAAERGAHDLVALQRERSKPRIDPTHLLDVQIERVRLVPPVILERLLDRVEDGPDVGVVPVRTDRDAFRWRGRRYRRTELDLHVPERPHMDVPASLQEVVRGLVGRGDGVMELRRSERVGTLLDPVDDRRSEAATS